MFLRQTPYCAPPCQVFFPTKIGFFLYKIPNQLKITNISWRISLQLDFGEFWQMLALFLVCSLLARLFQTPFKTPFKTQCFFAQNHVFSLCVFYLLFLSTAKQNVLQVLSKWRKILVPFDISPLQSKIAWNASSFKKISISSFYFLSIFSQPSLCFRFLIRFIGPNIRLIEEIVDNRPGAWLID